MVVTVDLVRPDDLLNLRIEAINLRLNPDRDSDNPDKPSHSLIVEDSQQPSYLVVTFPPQTIAEGAYFQAGGIDETKTANDNDSTRKLTDQKKNFNDPELDIPGLLDQSGKVEADPRRDPPRLTNALLGHPSRLVFKVPATAKIPFTIKHLLDWTGLELNVNPIAAIDRSPSSDQIENAPNIQPPAANETAIELPYKLIISPNREVVWKHRVDLFTSRGRTELWHTRLALKVPKSSETPDGIAELSRDRPAPLRAIWSDDYDPNNVPHPEKKDDFLSRTAMSPNDRHQIVVLTSAFHGYQVEKEMVKISVRPVPFLWHTVPYLPKPINAEQLILSPLGGWLRSEGHWSPLPKTAPPVIQRVPDIDQILQQLRSLTDHNPNVVSSMAVNVNEEFTASSNLTNPYQEYQLDLSEWVHIATEGRDHYVRIVYEGELWPFRHPASLVKVTERKFRENNGIVGAYLIQRMFIVVRDPDKEINHLGNPLKHVRLTTLVTPDIADPDDIEVRIKGTYRSFWVKVQAPMGLQHFMFHAIGTDHGNHVIDFTVPLIFVSKSDANNYGTAKLVANEYNDMKNIETRSAKIFGQKVMFAPQQKLAAKRNDNTQLVTHALNFVVDAAGNPPRMLKADVNIPQVQELLGTDTPTTIRYYEDYVNKAFDSATGVFAEVVKVKEDLTGFTPDDPFYAVEEHAVGLTFSADKAGGIATPNMAISTLTRELGPVAGTVKQAVENDFNPAEFFKDVNAKLFGSFELFKLLATTTLEANAPNLSTRMRDNTDGSKSLVTTLKWNPKLWENADPTDKKLDFEGIVAIEKDRNGETSVLNIDCKVEKPVNPREPPMDSVKSEFNGEFTNFSVSILRSVTINFVKFRFESRNGQKPDVTVVLDKGTPFKFDGDLEFIDDIRNAIPPGLFDKGSGPSIDLIDNPLGVRAAFALALPPLPVGVFALKDVSLGAALTLPFFDGKPVFDFNVSERQHPFLLTVSLFGGGGFFHLQLDTAGIKELEAALEFGAAAAIDIGVASGEVHIMAGIYFSLQRKEGSTGDLAAVLSGYLRMGGSLSVLALIRVSVEFNLSFTYDSGRKKAYGRATLTVHIDVAFFSKSVELTVERAFGGSNDPTFGDLFTMPEVWREYALAFSGG